MSFGRFYEHFAAAYGTIWLVLLLVAFVTQNNIDAGWFGVLGFPIMALVYAFWRRGSEGQKHSELDALRRRIARLEHDAQGL